MNLIGTEFNKIGGSYYAYLTNLPISSGKLFIKAEAIRSEMGSKFWINVCEFYVFGVRKVL